MLLRLVALLAMVATSSCSRASDESEAKQWSKPPPPKDDVAIPTTLAIDVTVDGAAKGAVTAATLATKQPDFVDTDRKAWLISTIIPEATAGTVVEAIGPTGVAVKFARPTADGLEPVLFLTRRAEVIVSAIDPKDPFPRYHGQGGRLHRAGDQLPRVAPVSRLVITQGSR
ncbi:MAG: hypothetical protein H0T79_14130 [Deltaproteobacteria bacterium]|nr:hypothetical protein [Deltaproteobacteria bacterium]